MIHSREIGANCLVVFLVICLQLPACEDFDAHSELEVTNQALEVDQPVPTEGANEAIGDGPSQPVAARWLVAADPTAIADSSNDSLMLEIRNRSADQWYVEVQLNFFGLNRESADLRLEGVLLEPGTSQTMSILANEIPLQNLVGACQVIAMLHASRDIAGEREERTFYSPALAYKFEEGFEKMRFFDLAAIKTRNNGRLNGITGTNAQVDKLIEKQLLRRRGGRLERTGDSASNIRIGRVRRSDGLVRDVYRNDSIRESRRGGRLIGFEVGEEIDLEVGSDVTD